MHEISSCPICESCGFTMFGQSSIFIQNSSILKCENCSFMFLQKQLCDDELVDFYNRKYRDKKQEQLTRNRYLGDKERAISQHDFWHQYVDKNANALEIGSGWGINANYLFENGYTHLTVNEWDDNINTSLNKNIHRIMTPVFDGESKYSFIIASHVLEHLFDLNGKVEKIKNKLIQNGKLFIEVPNVQNPAVRNLSSNSFHYWFFSIDNLLALFKKHHFDIVKFGAFGKEKYIEELNQRELAQWEADVENNKSSFIEMDASDKRALFLRVLLGVN